MQGPPENRSVLVLDDRADTLRLLAKLLRISGYVVHEAATCADALALLEREHCRVVVSSMDPLHDSTPTFMRAARARGLAVHSVAISDPTNLADPTAEARAAVAAGFERHLPKPFKLDDLLHELQRMMI